MSALTDSFLSLAQKVSGALAGPVVPAIVEIGKDVLKLIDNTIEVVDIEDADKLQAIRDELEPKVMAHADTTEKTLRGG